MISLTGLASSDTLHYAGSALAAWVFAQLALREWVREIEADMMYHDPDGMR